MAAPDLAAAAAPPGGASPPSRSRDGARPPGVTALLVGLEGWAPTAARLALGAVFLWFGSGELWQPRLWTGYVPLVPQTSGVAITLVLVHGALLLVLAASLVIGIAPRVAAGVGACFVAEIVVALTVHGGLNDISMRDLGVLGLALAVAGTSRHRLLLTR